MSGSGEKDLGTILKDLDERLSDVENSTGDTGTSLIDTIVSMLKKEGIWEKLEKEDQQKLLTSKDVTSVVPSSAVADVLAYLKNHVGKEFTKRGLSYVTRMFEGIERGTEIREPVYVLPSGEPITGKESMDRRILHGTIMLSKLRHWGETQEEFESRMIKEQLSQRS